MSCEYDGNPPPDFNLDVFEAATDLVAHRLAFFRAEDAEVSDFDRLRAGHLIGGLAANGFLVGQLPNGYKR